jgi:hypothetical protein
LRGGGDVQQASRANADERLKRGLVGEGEEGAAVSCRCQCRDGGQVGVQRLIGGTAEVEGGRDIIDEVAVRVPDGRRKVDFGGVDEARVGCRS